MVKHWDVGGRAPSITKDLHTRRHIKVNGDALGTEAVSPETRPSSDPEFLFFPFPAYKPSSEQEPLS